MKKLSDTKKHLRHAPPLPETKLWSCLRNRRCGGYKFRRQFPIGPYIADFFCLELNLVIEVDGDTHASRVQKDQERTNFLNKMGYRVIRFSNHDVMHNITGVIQSIIMSADETTTPPHPPRSDASGPLPLPLGEG